MYGAPNFSSVRSVRQFYADRRATRPAALTPSEQFQREYLGPYLPTGPAPTAEQLEAARNAAILREQVRGGA